MSDITKKALASSLKDLLSKYKFNKITIKDITENCGVNRQTFYYHFKDIYDLLEWIYKNEVILEIEEKATYETWQQGLMYIFEYVLKNKAFVKNTYYSISKDLLLNFIYAQTNILIMDVIEEKSKNINISNEDKMFIANFYKYGFVGLLQDWIESGMKQKPKVIINKLSVMIDGSFDNAFYNFQNLDK